MPYALLSQKHHALCWGFALRRVRVFFLCLRPLSVLLLFLVVPVSQLLYPPLERSAPLSQLLSSFSGGFSNSVVPFEICLSVSGQFRAVFLCQKKILVILILSALFRAGFPCTVQLLAPHAQTASEISGAA